MVTPGKFGEVLGILYQFKSYVFSFKQDPPQELPKQAEPKQVLYKQDALQQDVPKQDDQKQNGSKKAIPIIPKNIAYLNQLLLDQVESVYGLFVKRDSPLQISTTIQYQGITTLPHVYEFEKPKIKYKRDFEYDIVDEDEDEDEEDFGNARSGGEEETKYDIESRTVYLKRYNYYCPNERVTTVLFEPIAVRRDNQARLETVLRSIQASLLRREYEEDEQEYLAIIPIGEWATPELKTLTWGISHFTVIALSKQKGALSACIFDSREDPNQFVPGLCHVPLIYRIPSHVVPTLDAEINACFKKIFQDKAREMTVPRIYLGAQSLWDWNSCGYQQIKVIYSLFQGTLCVGKISDPEIAKKITPTKEELTAILEELAPKPRILAQTPPASPQDPGVTPPNHRVFPSPQS